MGSQVSLLINNNQFVGIVYKHRFLPFRDSHCQLANCTNCEKQTQVWSGKLEHPYLIDHSLIYTDLCQKCIKHHIKTIYYYFSCIKEEEKKYYLYYGCKFQVQKVELKVTTELNMCSNCNWLSDQYFSFVYPKDILFGDYKARTYSGLCQRCTLNTHADYGKWTKDCCLMYHALGKGYAKNYDI